MKSCVDRCGDVCWWLPWLLVALSDDVTTTSRCRTLLIATLTPIGRHKCKITPLLFALCLSPLSLLHFLLNFSDLRLSFMNEKQQQHTAPYHHHQLYYTVSSCCTFYLCLKIISRSHALELIIGDFWKGFPVFSVNKIFKKINIYTV